MGARQYLLISYRRTNHRQSLLVNPYLSMQKREAEASLAPTVVPLQLMRSDEREMLLLDRRFVTSTVGMLGGPLIIGRLDEAIERNIQSHMRQRYQRLFLPTDNLREQHMAIYAHQDEWYLQLLGRRRIGPSVQERPEGVPLPTKTTYWLTPQEEAINTGDATEGLQRLSRRREDPALFEPGVHPEQRRLMEDRQVELSFEQVTIDQLLDDHSFSSSVRTRLQKSIAPRK